MGPTPPCYIQTNQVRVEGKPSGFYYQTYSKEDPLQDFAIVVGVFHGVEAELVVLIIMLLQVKQDGGALKHDEPVAGPVDESGDATVRVDLEEPRFLLLARHDVYLLVAQ